MGDGARGENHLSGGNVCMSRLVFWIFYFASIITCYAVIAANYAHATDWYVDTDCANNGDGTTADCAGSPGGAGAFNSCSNWETTNGTLTEDSTVHFSGGSADTTACDINGWTFSTYTLTLEGDNTTGIWSTSHYRLESSDYEAPLRHYDGDLVVNQMQIYNSRVATAGEGAAIWLKDTDTGSDVTITNSILRCNPSSTSGAKGVSFQGSSFVPTTYIFANNVVVDCSNMSDRQSSGGTYVFYNNTFDQAGANALGTQALYLNCYSSVNYVYNNVVTGTSDAFYTESCTGTSLYSGTNFTSAADSLDGAGYSSKTFTFTDDTNFDYSLDASDASGAIGGGTDMSSDSTYPFSTDMTGSTRSAPWNAGALENDIVTYDISGTVTGDTVEGVTLTCTPSCGSDTSAVDGTYSITGINSGTSYTITPTLTDHTFSPTTVTGTLSADVTNADFVSTDNSVGDYACGRDTNFDDSVDNQCAGSDQDADGFVLDADDNDEHVFTGVKEDSNQWHAGLSYADGIEPGTASDCPSGYTCYYVDCDAVSDGTGTYASPYWGFETVLGYESGGTFYQGVITSTTDTKTIVYVTGTCDCGTSTEDATGPFKQIRYWREMGDSSDPVTIKSYLGVSRAVFDGEDTCDSGIEIKNVSQGGGVRIQNILIQGYLISGIRVEEDYDYVDISSVEVTGIKGDGTGTYGPVMIYHKDAATAQQAFLRNSYLHDNDKNAVGGLNNRGTINYHSVYTANTSSLFTVQNTLVEDGAYCYRVKHYGGQMLVKQSICRDAVGIALVRTNTFTLQQTVADNITFIDPVDLTSNNGIMLDVENMQAGYQLTFIGTNNTFYKVPFVFATPSVPNDNVVITWQDNIIDAISPTGKFLFLAQYAADSFDVSEYTGGGNMYNISASSEATFADINDTDYSFSGAMTALSETGSSVDDPELADPDNHDYSSDLSIGAVSTNTSACAAGEYRYAQADGSWSSCAAISTYDCQDEMWPTFARLSNGTTTSLIEFRAWEPGTDGNSLTVTITNGTPMAFSVVGDDIAITADTSSDTVNDVIDFILADGSYRGIFMVSAGEGGGTGLITALSQTNLSGGSADRTYLDVIWVDLDAVSSGDGSYASPYNDFDDLGRGTSVEEATAGDCIVIKGTDSTFETNDGTKSAVLYVRGPMHGTETNPIRWTNWPGERWEINPATTCPTTDDVDIGIYLYETKYNLVDGSKISGLCSDVKTYGIWSTNFSNSHGNGIKNVIFTNIEGPSSANSAAIFIQGDSTSGVRPDEATITNNFFYDMFNDNTASVNGGAAIMVARGDWLNISYNVLGEKTASTVGEFVRFKHADSDIRSLVEVGHNIAVSLEPKGAQAGAGVGGGPANMWAHHNYFQSLETGDSMTCFLDVDEGGAIEQINHLIEFNTCLGPTALRVDPDANGDLVNISDIENFTYQYNVNIGQKTSAYTQDSALVEISPYGEDTEYDLFVAEANLDYNCYFNDQAQTERYDLFVWTNGATNDQGASYTTFASWQAADTSGVNDKPAWEQHSFEEDPELNVRGVATSTNCGSFGWRTEASSVVLSPSLTTHNWLLRSWR